MTRFVVSHKTSYVYRTPVDVGFHLLRVTPLNKPGQRSLGQRLSIVPEPARLNSFIDHFGNVVHHVAVEQIHERLTVTLEAAVEVMRELPREEGPTWETIREAMRGDGFPEEPMVAEFAFPSPLAAPEERATQFAAQSFTDGRPIVAGLRALCERIHEEFAYVPNSTDIGTQVSEVMTTRRGVCQDFAHVMIAGLRGLGLPARYASGYLHNRPAEEGARLGADAGHAWVSAWCGEALGWIELDPTNNLLVENEHIVVAYGRDFSDVTPLRGVILGGGRHTLSVEVSVTDLDGTTLPLSPDQR